MGHLRKLKVIINSIEQTIGEWGGGCGYVHPSVLSSIVSPGLHNFPPTRPNGARTSERILEATTREYRGVHYDGSLD